MFTESVMRFDPVRVNSGFNNLTDHLSVVKEGGETKAGETQKSLNLDNYK